MEAEKNIFVEMYRVENDLTVLVKVDFLDIEAQEHSALMLVDSGSNSSVLLSNVMAIVGNLQKIDEEQSEILTTSGDRISANHVQFPFYMGGVQFVESFNLCEGALPRIAGSLPIIGILGIDFLLSHSLVIDYSNFSLHTSKINHENFSISDCDFFFPMEIGLNNYGLPVLCMCQNNWEITVLADTGASDNLLSALTLVDNGFHCDYTEETDSIEGLSGKTSARKASMKFELVSAGVDEEILVPHEDTFLIIPHTPLEVKKDALDENGNPLDSIEAMIGSPFMAKEGWALDFGAGIIYKLKKMKNNFNVCNDIRVKSAKVMTEEKKAKKTISFFRNVEVGLPFIRIDEGNFEGMVFLIDTGSNKNILFGYAYNQMKNVMKKEDGNEGIFGLDGISSKAHIVSGTLTFCGQDYDMSFLLKEENLAGKMLSEQIGFSVAGIIGTEFMAEHDWVIDFRKQEIAIPKGDISASTNLQKAS